MSKDLFESVAKGAKTKPEKKVVEETLSSAVKGNPAVKHWKFTLIRDEATGRLSEILADAQD